MVELDDLEIKKKNYWFIITFLSFWVTVVLTDYLKVDDNPSLWWLPIIIFDILWLSVILMSVFCYFKGRAYWYFGVSFNDTLGIPKKSRKKFVFHKLIRNIIGGSIFLVYSILALSLQFPFTYTITAFFILAVLIYGSGLWLKKYLVDPDEDDSIIDDEWR